MKTATTSRLVVEELIDVITQLNGLKTDEYDQRNYLINRSQFYAARIANKLDSIDSVYPRPVEYFLENSHQQVLPYKEVLNNFKLITLIYYRELPENIQTDWKILNYFISCLNKTTPYTTNH